MKLSKAFSLLGDLRFALKIGLLPTFKDVLANPRLLLQPHAISRAFMGHVWVTFGAGTDEGARAVKTALIPPNAYGTVLDIGAGHGHTMKYLDRQRVTKYVALEPNTHMHDGIRSVAADAGFSEADGSLVIISAGLEDTKSILRDLGTTPQNPPIDTLISILTLCSIPSPETSLTRVVRDVLKDGGQFLFYEHVQSHLSDVAWWQRFWSPLWSTAFDGCRLDRPTHVWVRDMTDADVKGNVRSMWQSSDVWGKEGEPEEHLFWHRVGKYVKHK